MRSDPQLWRCSPGGIGKTTLLQKLERLHRQRCPLALMGRLDLADADTTPPDLLLYRLRRRLPNIPFPSFSLALADHGRRLHPEQVFGSDRRELLQGAGPYADVLAGGLEMLDRRHGQAAACREVRIEGPGDASETAALMPEVHGLL